MKFCVLLLSVLALTNAVSEPTTQEIVAAAPTEKSVLAKRQAEEDPVMKARAEACCKKGIEGCC